ncbi:protein ANTI-SILENCING 1-like [Wolffia australiana]
MAQECVHFEWGEKRGRGKDRDVQFYGSFTYDGVEYALYDCVYLYKEGEPEPFVGKLIKIWEQKGNLRRVKILWFFRPIEIHNFLREYEKPLRNELFLACGDGEGLTDVNTLESIGGKCNVICTSKEQRNRQPSEEELKDADYIFYRTFDVGSLTLSNEFGENIAGVEVKYLFNLPLVHIAVCGADGRTSINEFGDRPPQNPSLILETPQVTKMASELEGRKELKRAAPSSPLDSRNSKKLAFSDASRAQKSSIAANEPEDNTHATATEKIRISDVSRTHKGAMAANEPEEKAHPAATEKAGFSDGSGPQKSSVAANGSEEKKVRPTAIEKAGFSDAYRAQKSSVATNGSEEKKARPAATEKTGYSDASRTQKTSIAASRQEEKARSGATELSHEETRPKLDNESPVLSGEELTGKLKSSGRGNRQSNEMIGESTLDVSVEKERKVPKTLEVPRRPRVETSKYFTSLPWETRILEAQQHGTLVLLENFDVVHTSDEIEDMIYHFFQKQCTGRVIERSMFSSPYLGRALIICKNRGDAEEIVKKLKEKVLLLSNGRPLIARVMPSRRPREESTSRKFHGHFVIERTRPQPQREETKKAVSTSHCAQPNTLEYELAAEWMGLHDKTEGWWRLLHEEHEREAAKADARLARRRASPTPPATAKPPFNPRRPFPRRL